MAFVLSLHRLITHIYNYLFLQNTFISSKVWSYTSPCVQEWETKFIVKIGKFILFFLQINSMVGCSKNNRWVKLVIVWMQIFNPVYMGNFFYFNDYFNFFVFYWWFLSSIISILARILVNIYKLNYFSYWNFTKINCKNRLLTVLRIKVRQSDLGKEANMSRNSEREGLNSTRLLR
jgi:hypothetical protein